MSEALSLFATNEFIIDIAAGSVGGFMSKAIDYPFDSAKVLLQTQQQQHPTTVVASTKPSSTTTTAIAIRQYTGTWDCIQHSIQQNGFTSLYRGIGSRLLGSMVENAVCFWSYASIKRELSRLKQQAGGNDNNTTKLSYLDLSIAGAGSGAAVSFVMTPVELIKCRLQVSAQLPTPIYKSSWDCVVQTIQQSQSTSLLRRLSYLYQGHLSTMAREVPGNFGWYLTYELVCDAIATSLLDIPRDELPVRAHMTAGSIAGVMYWAAIFPIDTIKSVLQTQTISTTTPGSSTNTTSSSTFRQAFQTIYEERGIRGLYRGFGVTTLRAAPANAVLFAAYEQTVQFLKE